MTIEPDEFYEELSPNIRKLVRQLHEWGYKTTDSGDGTNHDEGMECAVPFPMVVIKLPSTSGALDHEANHLHQLLQAAGVPMGDEGPTGKRKVEASYEPGEPSLLLVLNVADEDLGENVTP